MTAPATESAPLLAPPPRRSAPPTTGVDDPFDWRWLALGIAALAILASATGLANGFAYDDRWIIVENKRVHTLVDAWKFFGQTYWPNERGAALYRPLTILFYAIEWVVGRGAPLVYHIVNVVLYAGVSVLVFRLGLEMLPTRAAWVAAALFAVHPVHVEAVGNVVGQAELWTAFVVLGCVILYLRDRRGGLPLDSATVRVILELFALGLLIKENAIVLPALLVAAELFVVDDPRPWRVRAAAMRPLILWLTLAAVAFLYVRVLLLGELGGDVSHPALHGLGMGQRSWLMLGLLPEFGRLFVWPDRLYADYSPRQVPIHTAWSVDLLPGALLLGCLAILAFVAWRRSRAATFGIAWLVLTIAPVANVLIATGILIAERTLLLPSVGVVLVAGAAVPWVVYELQPRPRVMKLLAGGVLAVVLMLGAAHSAERQYAWRDSDAVFKTMASDAPLNFKAHYVLGGQYFEQKRPVEGEREWRYAIALMPDYYGVYVDLAHKYRDAHVCQAAVPMYHQALAMEPALPLARAGLVACYLELAQWRKARAESRSAIADGFYRRAFEFMIEKADSALVATDSLDGTNRWTGASKLIKP